MSKAKPSRYVTHDELEALVEERVRKTLAQMIGAVAPHEEFAPTSQAWRALGYTSQKQLYGAIKSGLLRMGSEFEDRSQSSTPRYYFNLAKCRERMKTPPEKRP